MHLMKRQPGGSAVLVPRQGPILQFLKYNVSVVKKYYAMSSLARFENNFFLLLKNALALLYAMLPLWL
jgi:hypothetical protein